MTAMCQSFDRNLERHVIDNTMIVTYRKFLNFIYPEGFCRGEGSLQGLFERLSIKY